MWNSFSITVHFLTLILFESFKFSDFKLTDLESRVQTRKNNKKIIKK